MCHVIHTKKSIVFLHSRHYSFFYGVKSILFDRVDKIICGTFFRKKYNISIINDRLFVEKEGKNHEQEVLLVIQSIRPIDRMIPSVKIPSGFHISGFKLDDTDHKLYSTVPIFKDFYYPDNFEYLVIPAAFFEEDIVFFDGKDVSVSRFFIPCIDDLINLNMIADKDREIITDSVNFLYDQMTIKTI